jgi:hypothetical protein
MTVCHADSLLLQEGVQAKLDELVREETQILQRQAVLKKSLYARFGASINLEA